MLIVYINFKTFHYCLVKIGSESKMMKFYAEQYCTLFLNLILQFCNILQYAIKKYCRGVKIW